jgi:electron transport complex protein RnfG
MMRRIVSLALTLTVVCAAAAFALAYTYSLTRERIQAQIKEQEERAARSVIPAQGGVQPTVQEVEGKAKELSGRYPGIIKVYSARTGETLVGHALQVRSRGYGGPVILMVGIRPGGEVAAVAVVEHRETPGLGNYIDDPAWRDQFAGKTRRDTLAANKDINTVSGATISGKAVIRGVREAVEAFELLKGGGA